MREARDITWMDNGAVLVGSKAGHEARRPTDRLALFSPLPPVDAARLRDPAQSARRRRSGPRLARPEAPVSDIARATAKAALNRCGWTPPDR